MFKGIRLLGKSYKRIYRKTILCLGAFGAKIV